MLFAHESKQQTTSGEQNLPETGSGVESSSVSLEVAARAASAAASVASALNDASSVGTRRLAGVGAAPESLGLLPCRLFVARGVAELCDATAATGVGLRPATSDDVSNWSLIDEMSSNLTKLAAFMLTSVISLSTALTVEPVGLVVA